MPTVTLISRTRASEGWAVRGEWQGRRQSRGCERPCGCVRGVRKGVNSWSSESMPTVTLISHTRRG